MIKTKYLVLITNSLVVGFTGCTCFDTNRSEPSPRPLMSIVSREFSGPERVIRVPENGLALSDVVTKKPGATTSASLQRSVEIDLGEAVRQSSSNLANRIASIATNEGATIEDVFVALRNEALPGHIQMKNMKRDLDSLVALKSVKFADSNDSTSFTDKFIKYVFEKKKEIALDEFVKSEKLLVESSANKAPQASTDGDQQSVVLLRRRNGNEFLFPYSSVSNTSIGAILLTNGDWIFRETQETLVAPSEGVECNVVIVGGKDDNDPVLPCKAGSDYSNALTNQQPDATDAIVLTRLNPLGKAQTHVLPLADKRALASYRPQDGDIVQFATLDLMPIVLGSRAIHRQQQREALMNEHTSAERARLKDLSKTTLSERFSSTVRKTNKLPIAKQARAFSIIAGERINSGLDTVGGAIGIR